MTIEKVQQWVVSALICAVAAFPIGALIVTGFAKDGTQEIGTARALCVMAIVIGVMAVAAGRLVHRRSPASPLLMVGALPGLVALLWLAAP